jgi:DNA-binding NtrC family response regulator
MNAVLSYDWPGNVRELENLIKKIVVLESEEFALKELIIPQSRVKSSVSATPSSEHGRISLKKAGKMAAQEAEKQLILGTLVETRWNRKKAAEQLEISYKALLYKIKQNGLSKKKLLA